MTRSDFRGQSRPSGVSTDDESAERRTRRLGARPNDDLFSATRMDVAVAARLLELGSRSERTEEERAEIRGLIASVSADVSRTLARALATSRRDLDRAGCTTDDLAQHVLVQLAEGKLPSEVESRSATSVVLGWSIRVARNKLKDELRSSRVRSTRSADDAEGASLFERYAGAGSADTLHEGRELARVADACAQQLAPKRLLLWAKLLEEPDADVAELAAAVGYAIDAGEVSVQVRNAVFALRHETKLAMARCIEARGLVKLWAPRASSRTRTVGSSP